MTSHNENDVREGYCGNCHDSDLAAVSGSPFPDSRPLRELIEGEPATYELPPDAPWRFMHVSSLVSWQRCDCPWWHRLPFVSRFVHSDLP